MDNETTLMMGSSGGGVIVAAADDWLEAVVPPSFDEEVVAEEGLEIGMTKFPLEDELLAGVRLLMELLLAELPLGNKLLELALPPADEPLTLEDLVTVAPEPDDVFDGTPGEALLDALERKTPAEESLTNEPEREPENELLKTEFVGEESLDSGPEGELGGSVGLLEELLAKDLLK